MKTKIVLTTLMSILAISPCLTLQGNALQKLLAPFDSRYITFKYALELLDQRRALTIVETGTARDGGGNCQGDGCSTLIWGDWAARNGAHLYSVDISPKAINKAVEGCKPYLNNITFVCSDSVNFLNQFGQPIDLLYLDSYDLDLANPGPSQNHHLNEIIAAYPFLHKYSVVMIDDCAFACGGKGKLVIQYLLDRGWRIVMSDYQVILVRD